MNSKRTEHATIENPNSKTAEPHGLKSCFNPSRFVSRDHSQQCHFESLPPSSSQKIGKDLSQKKFSDREAFTSADTFFTQQHADVFWADVADLIRFYQEIVLKDMVVSRDLFRERYDVPWALKRSEIFCHLCARGGPDVLPASVPIKPAASDLSDKLKRKRLLRRSAVMKKREYVEPKETDVLLGRGGRSNHNPGNQSYLKQVKVVRPFYTSLDNNDEKTELSLAVVKFVHNKGGRFLKKDSGGWYVVEDNEARIKASQALRDNDDPEKRAAKRQLSVEKRVALENERHLPVP